MAFAAAAQAARISGSQLVPTLPADGDHGLDGLFQVPDLGLGVWWFRFRGLGVSV